MFIILLFIYHVQSEQVAVEINKGTVIGEKVNNVNVFYGIPYAKVDEDKPFEDTTDYPNFTTPFNATDSTIICPQVLRTVGGTIQCLTLNIYVPNNVKPETNALPVFVWFFGGGFVMGDANSYNPKYFIKHGIIFIAVNYRLGPYGFLCTDHKNIKNQGLKDQVNALKWVQENIEGFGGDRTKVTIGGQSYGGGAVDFHLYYKDRMFKQAIVQSGSKYAYGINSKKNDTAPILLANYLGYSADDVKSAMKILNKADPISVMNATRNLGLRFGVCKSKSFNHEENIRDTPILIGFNSKEDFGGFATQTDEFYQQQTSIFDNTLASIFKLKGSELNKATRIVKDFYLGAKNVSKDAMLELVDFSSDFKLNFAVERSVDDFLRLNNSRVFKYVFSYTGGSIYSNISGVGAYHTEELQYLFDMGGSEHFNAQQVTILDRMTTFWSNFIKYGNPNLLQAGILPESWRPTDVASRGYWDIDTSINMKVHVYHNRMSFWRLLWTCYGNKG